MVRHTDAPLIQVRIKQNDGTYGRLQGWQASSQIRANSGALLATALASIKSDTTSDYLEFDYPQLDLADAPDGVHRWDCFYQAPDGRIQQGPWEYWEMLTWATAIPPAPLTGGTTPATTMRPIVSVTLNAAAALVVNVSAGAAIGTATSADTIFLSPPIPGQPTTVQGVIEQLLTNSGSNIDGGVFF